MKFIKKHLNLSITILFALLYIGFWRIAVDTINTVKIEDLREDEDTGESKPKDVEPADVVLKVEAPGYSTTYDIKDFEDLRMYNNESIWDLIDILRDKNALTYEQTEYTYGLKITEVNNISSDTLVWNIYADGKLVEDDFSKVKLDDEVTYTLRLE